MATSATLDRAAATLDPLRSPEALAEVPLERIESEITELAAHINAATCRWLCLVAELDRREGWASWGAKSCAHWLSWRCSVSPSAAREHVRVARRLADLPSVRRSFAAGELSYSKVRALTRVVTPATEDELVGIARHATAAQIEVMVRSYRRAAAGAEVAEANARHRRRSLTYFYDDEGFLVLRARLMPEDGAVVVAALTAAAAELGPPDPSENVSAETSEAHPLRFEERNADALVAVADRALSGGPGSPARPEVVVHVDADALAGRDGRSELDDGMHLPPETTRRLACDAPIVTLVERDGEPLSGGRRTRRVPAALRRALRARDRRCRFPGCTEARHVDAHHVRHWADGGPTSLDNLVQLCRFHHRFVHEGHCTVEMSHRGPRFTLPDGTTVEDAAAPPPTDPGVVPRANAALGVDVDAETIVPLWTGETMDYDSAVAWLLSASPTGRASSL
jgi:hypothetical protein